MKKTPILLVDGYNMIAFWQETKSLFKTNQLDEARQVLIQKLNHYAHFEHIDIICVFDAHHVPGLKQQYDQYKISVVFTQEDETADSYIERLAAELNQSRLNIVSVATSDLNEQWTVFSQGALRVSARELEQRVNAVKSDLDKMSDHIDLTTPRLGSFSDQQLGQLQDFLDQMD
ncbi:NYN domain-containing protein [Streptococcus sp. zg-JUN1979]|uniref:NYN domain-containing protein n=1 Tax=Streptococcus sp. zg-JUN1979 TaxID=3391450 RepID=UPI0039B11246